VRDAVAARVATPVLVKWPNDVLAGGRKLAGILVESQVSGAKIKSAIVGIGINVAQTAFPEAVADIATSLSLLSASSLSRETLLADLLSGLEARLVQLEAQGIAGISEALRPHDALLGRRLRVDVLEGTGAGIDGAGCLLLRCDDASVTPLSSGHVELLDH
jgi:BirA family biotin operon repressor/biotin-[acetyl-CoA-carboxylase] ligase